MSLLWRWQRGLRCCWGRGGGGAGRVVVRLFMVLRGVWLGKGWAVVEWLGWWVEWVLGVWVWV